jgi:hypothetical protein
MASKIDITKSTLINKTAIFSRNFQLAWEVFCFTVKQKTPSLKNLHNFPRLGGFLSALFMGVFTKNPLNPLNFKEKLFYLGTFSHFSISYRKYKKNLNAKKFEKKRTF